ncbi:GNAT family N-acetyltransferase [Kribbella speibonae]|uniref:GNAT family N-acetyltransferase n=1 Tax=Kribbella speibonae TaxID=1572660 RepID=A0A4R0IS01_9ACTN|nr:GNAT family N-acetyltransferase [Kribbella speibonae]TCC35450.1 GNAT family N-acetyltransferase [Kribbella speibonae]
MVTIRPADRDDGPAVAKIYVEGWNAGFGELMPVAVLDDARIARWSDELADGNWWVAEVGGEIAGLVGIGPSRDPIDPELGELDTITVAPPYWRQGIGSALMQKALEELAARYDEAILWTLANYPRAQNFYTKTGWTLTDTTRDNGHQVSYRRTF